MHFVDIFPRIINESVFLQHIYFQICVLFSETSEATHWTESFSLIKVMRVVLKILGGSSLLINVCIDNTKQQQVVTYMSSRWWGPCVLTALNLIVLFLCYSWIVFVSFGFKSFGNLLIDCKKLCV
jgi:hypothetical protein